MYLHHRQEMNKTAVFPST